MSRIGACVIALLVSLASEAPAQEAQGTLTANGQSAELKHALAFETDSIAEPGYMDVVVVISDRKLIEAVARDRERLEALSRTEGLVALRVALNPDAKVMSAAPIHPAFTMFLSSPLWARWEPSAYDEARVARRFFTDGAQNELKQQWSYDVTFSAPVLLDPEAQTQPTGQP